MSIEARFRLERGAFRLDAALQAPGRGVTAVFGPSGCGKTTLLRAVAGLERTADGYCRVGQTVWQDGTRILPPHRRPVGYVFQEASLFPHLTVRGNLEYGLKRVPAGQRRIGLDEVVALLSLETLLDRRPQRLSGGERQRVALGRALAVSPRLLLMDEPLAALDAARKRDILPYLERLPRELDMPILYVSHDLDEVARLADHLALMADGRVTAAGGIRDMLTRLDLPPAHAPDAEALVEAEVAGHDADYHLSRLRFPAGEAQVLVRLDAGGVPLLSRITRRSADALGLHPGSRVFVQIKTVALVG